jgi:hypothetical protein
VADFGRAEAPDIEFPIPPGWARIQRVAELWEHGTHMRLCVRPGEYGAGDYVMSLLLNRSVFLFHAETEALAQFRRLPGNAWALGQCVLANNARPPDALLSVLTMHIRNAGVMLLPTMAGDALDVVLRPLRMREHDRTEEDVTDEDLDIDEFAA